MAIKTNAVAKEKQEKRTEKKKLNLACKDCLRRDVCRDFATCMSCIKGQPEGKEDSRMKAPSLKVYGLRTDEILPIEPAFIAVDSTGIKFFTCRPHFKYEDSYNTNGRWTTGCFEDQIACLRYDYLDGIFDTAPFRRGFHYDFEHMISPL